MAGSKRKMTTIAPVESIRGKIAPAKQKAGEGVKQICGYVRATSPYNRFQLLVNGNTKDPSASQMEWMTLFGQISAGVKARRLDPTKMALDQVNFAKQSRYKTLYSYQWHLVKEELENE